MCVGGGVAQFYAKKVRGLLIPYILWCLIGCAVGSPLIVLNNYMQGHAIVERTVFESHSLWGTLDAVFGICRVSPRALGVLWFVRSLLILFLFAPLWRILARASLAWIFIPIFCFLYGCFPVINVADFGMRIGLSSFFFLGIVAATYLPKPWIFTKDDDIGKSLISKSFSSICMLSFWIYVTHNLFMGYLIAIGHTLNRQLLLPLAFIAPLVFFVAVALSITSACLIRRYFPRTFSMLNGDR